MACGKLMVLVAVLWLCYATLRTTEDAIKVVGTSAGQSLGASVGTMFGVPLFQSVGPTLMGNLCHVMKGDWSALAVTATTTTTTGWAIPVTWSEIAYVGKLGLEAARRHR